MFRVSDFKVRGGWLLEGVGGSLVFWENVEDIPNNHFRTSFAHCLLMFLMFDMYRRCSPAVHCAFQSFTATLPPLRLHRQNVQTECISWISGFFKDNYVMFIIFDDLITFRALFSK